MPQHCCNIPKWKRTQMHKRFIMRTEYPQFCRRENTAEKKLLQEKKLEKGKPADIVVSHCGWRHVPCHTLHLVPSTEGVVRTLY